MFLLETLLEIPLGNVDVPIGDHPLVTYGQFVQQIWESVGNNVDVPAGDSVKNLLTLSRGCICDDGYMIWYRYVRNRLVVLVLRILVQNSSSKTSWQII